MMAALPAAPSGAQSGGPDGTPARADRIRRGKERG
jgi:hypothetical protein